MSIKFAIVAALCFALAACGKKEDVPSSPVLPESEVAPAVEPAATMTPEPAVVESQVPVVTAPEQETEVTAEQTGQVMEKPTPAMTESTTPELNEPAAKAGVVSGKEVAVLSREDALALANKSGCLACHSVEKKVVGPAWQDVGAKYKGDSSVKTRLIDKVKKGGKGNWTAVTNGVPMPPYSPRVPDADIEKLVSFVLSLG